ncbi:MAG: CinA family nicotinamide mononucleotide deamidase-related protein [Verrucomicrobiota bacterium]|nr:CinA family nicotinamide mononucleotide deamidase-related protein [Verrucomicrobiota bacterium]
MKAKITFICIGTELLAGRTLNSNLAFAGKKLEQAGFLPTLELTVSDNPTDISDALDIAEKRSNITITIGGLGPTSDDITAETVYSFLHCPVHLNKTLVSQITSFLQTRKININLDNIKKQALVPENSTIISNANGTAPGIWYEKNKKITIMLPGPPQEFCPMFEDILKKIEDIFIPEFFRKTGFVIGTSEAVVAQKTVEVLKKYPMITPEYCACPEGVRLTLSTNIKYADKLKNAFAESAKRFGLSFTAGEKANIAKKIGDILVKKNWKLATVESCTGGMIAAKITDLPGASDFYCGSVITYSNEWKNKMLGVTSETLEKDGAVSIKTAKEMLKGIMTKYAVECGIAVTGIAGPTGGTAEKPVGLVYIGTLVKGDIHLTENFFKGTRKNIRERTVARALNQMYFHLKQVYY